MATTDQKGFGRGLGEPFPQKGSPKESIPLHSPHLCGIMKKTPEKENLQTMRTGICTTDFENAGQTPLAADRLFGRMQELGFVCTQFAFSSIRESEFTPTGRIEIPDRYEPTCFRDFLEGKQI